MKAALSDQLLAAMLYSGDLAGACGQATVMTDKSADPFWVKMSVFCAAANADRANVDFQLGLLEELQTVHASFYALTDIILVEAEAASAIAASTLGQNAHQIIKPVRLWC